MMKTLRSNILVLLLCAVCCLQVVGQQRSPLPRSTPEEQGVPSAAISIFLDSVAASKHEYHSFMFVRHGKVIAEGWWNPYQPDLKHTLYSLSKSFTATAVGFAKADGRLSLTDKVISFFPAELPDTISTQLQNLKISDLLTMSLGQQSDPTVNLTKDSNWVRSFLALPIQYQPGTRFLYNSTGTYMLSAIVQKVTGQKVVDYLQSRLFEPLGITGMDWETDPKGINTGGWGLRLKTEDIAKFGQLFLQKGVWNGQQVLPEGWAEEASAAHIIQHPAYAAARRNASDWEQGYGYQMWRSRHNAYRGDGAFGQYAIVMPEQDAVIVITSETTDMQGEMNLIWKLLLPAMENRRLQANKLAVSALQRKLASLQVPVKSSTANPTIPAIAGKKFAMEPNVLNLQSLTFNLKDNTFQLRMKTDTADYTFYFAANTWQLGETNMPGPYLLSAAKNNLVGLSPFKVAGRYTWVDSDTLELSLRYIESPHTRTLLCHFDGDKISLEIRSSFSNETLTLDGKSE